MFPVDGRVTKLTRTERGLAIEEIVTVVCRDVILTVRAWDQIKELCFENTA